MPDAAAIQPRIRATAQPTYRDRKRHFPIILYPETALGEFRAWFRGKYIAEGRFKKYLDTKVKDKQLPVSFAQLAIAAYVRD